MTETYKPNGRFDKLTNLDISTYYRNKEFYLMKKNFTSAFVYWVVSQSPYDTPDISDSLKAFNEYIKNIFKDDIVKKFTYDEIHDIISEKVFENIPEIEKLNHSKIDTGQEYLFTSRYVTINPDYDFIDLCALARNISYMIMREQITQG